MKTPAARLRSIEARLVEIGFGMVFPVSYSEPIELWSFDSPEVIRVESGKDELDVLEALVASLEARLAR